MTPLGSSTKQPPSAPVNNPNRANLARNGVLPKSHLLNPNSRKQARAAIAMAQGLGLLCDLS
eukprot:CAMPEP_0172735682 /NCGR_PEP_ID=MMETSP1074-20121228/113091_1 /TAXON_ID=2916 /ORGANISM="Ceratium fusus, Strain PA161109" /LENGTH=61 /DNA_ID=CAMNT_0013564733 /DNA_START=67 /DNA_END=250 /DNA_ORIENTATION=-